MEADAPDPAELLAQVAWARRMAASLVRDPQLAEDLAQDALESGLRLQRRPRAGVRAWLVGTLRKLRAQAARNESRRRRREEAATPAPVPSTPDRLLEKVEAQRRIAEALARLPEPERSALILRYHEELSFRRIGVALGISEKAAESRVYRGLQRLRAEFREREGANWAATFLPLLQPTASAAAAALSGVWIMTTNTKWLLGAVGVLALLGSSLLLLDDPTAAATEKSVLAPGAWSGAPPASAAAPEATAAMGAGGSALSGEMAREEARQGLWLRILGPAGEPLAGAEVFGLELTAEQRLVVDNYQYLPEYQFGHREPAIRGISGSDGRVRLREDTGRFRGMLFIRGAGTLQQVFAVEEAEEAYRDLGDFHLGRGAYFQIRFVEEDGNPVQNARIWFSSQVRRQPRGHLGDQTVFTDASGLARFDSVPPGLGTVVCRGPGYLPWQLEGAESTLEPQPPETVILSRGDAAPILVVDAQGAPVAGAEIYEDFSIETTATAVHPGWPFFLGFTAADGSFLVRGLREYGLRIIAKSGPAWTMASLEASAEVTRIVLRPVHVLSGRVRHLGGAIEEGGQLVLADPIRRMQVPYLRLALDASGAFAVPLPAGSYGLGIRHPQGSLVQEGEIALGADLDLGEIVVPAGPELRLRCVDAADGSPLAEATAHLARPTDAEWISSTRWRTDLARWASAPSGFRLEGEVLVGRHLRLGAQRLALSAPGYLMQEIEVELGPEGAERTVALQAETRLTLSVLDQDGRPVAGEDFELLPEGYDALWMQAKERIEPTVHPVQASTDAAGVAEVGFLFPGHWRLQYLWRPEGLVLAEFDLRAGSNEQAVRVPQATELDFEVSHRGAGVADASIEIRRKSERGVDRYGDGYENGGFSVTTDASGRARFRCKEPGDYRFRVLVPGSLPAELHRSVAGAHQRVPIELDGAVVSGTLRSGAPLTAVVLYQFRSMEGTEEQRIATVAAFVGNGRDGPGGADPWRRYAVARVDPGQEFRFSGLEPGRYYLVACAEGWARSPVQALEVGEQDLSGLSVGLEPAAGLLVRVRGVPEFRARHPGMELRLEFAVGRDRVEGRPFRMVEDGDCRFDTLSSAPGELVVLLNAPDFSSRKELRRIAVAPIAGQRIELDLDAATLTPEPPR